MLSQIKTSIRGIVMTIIIGLLLVSLAIWGVSDAFSPKSKNAAAMVGHEPISLQDFSDFFNRRLKEENKKSSERMTTKDAYNKGLQNVVINQLITEKLIQIDADDLGLAVNRRDARQYVEDLEVFNNDITGKLDERKLMTRLAQIDRNLTRRKFEENLRAEIRRDQSLSAIVGGITAPEEYADQQYKFLTEQRKIKALNITKDAIVLPPEPNDDALKAYIKEHQNRFIAPEYRRFTLMHMEVSDVLPDTKVTDEELKDKLDYKIKVGQLGTPETRSVIQFVAKDENTANEIANALSQGKPKTDIETEFKVDAPIEYTDVIPGAITDPKASEAAFVLKDGAATVVESSFGTWYAIMVTNITPAYTPTLESERANLTEELKKEKAQLFLADVWKTIQNNVDEGMTLEEAAKASGIGIASYDYVSRIGQTIKGETLAGDNRIPGIARDDKILKEIFLSDPGFEGDLFETTNKGLAAIRVEDIKPSAPQSFEDSKEKALEYWKLEKTAEAINELSNKLMERANKGEKFEAIAKDFDQGVTVIERTVSRTMRSPDFNTQNIVRLFDARPNQIISGPAPDGVGRQIAKVIEIIPNTDVLAGAMSENVKSQTAQMINSDIQQAYHAALLRKHPSTIIERNIVRALGVGEE